MPKLRLRRPEPFYAGLQPYRGDQPRRVASVAGRLKQLSRDTARAEPFVFALFVQGAAAASKPLAPKQPTTDVGLAFFWIRSPCGDGFSGRNSS